MEEQSVPQVVPTFRTAGARLERRGRVLGWLQRPLVSLVLVVLLAADAVFVFRAYTWGGAKNDVTTTSIPRWVSRQVFGLKVPDLDFAYPWSSMFVREDAGYRDLDSNLSSADELTKLLASRPGDVVQVRRTRCVGRLGAWAPTRAVAEHRLRITRMSDGGRVQDERPVRAAYALTMYGRRDPEHERLGSADILESRTIWWGYVHNAWTLILLACLLLSLAWVPRMWGEGRRQRLLGRQLCPGCTYDLSATREANGMKTCPECGRSWDMSRAVAARRSDEPAS